MIETCPTKPLSGGTVTDSPHEPARNAAMASARDELAVIGGQLNDGHARLIALMRRVLADELWCGVGLKSPEQWLTAYAGLTWSSAHDIVRIAERSVELPNMQRLLDDGTLSLGQAAVVAKYTPTDFDADVAEFASYTTVTQLRRALCRYEFNADSAAAAASGTESALLPGDAADHAEHVDSASDAVIDSAPAPFDPATAPPRLDMRYAAGRFVLSYDAPADIGALVEQALLEAKDELFRIDTPGEASRNRGAASFGAAMGLMAQRSLDTGAPIGHSRASRYRVYLHLDTSGNSWLNKRSAIPPALRDRIVCDGVIQPVWETDGKPVSVGRAQRIVPARTRRLLEDRDRGCRYPGCLAMHHLECHHLDHWIDGGQTDADRMVMLCPFHHDEHHRGTFVMVGDPSRPDGIIFTARDGSRLRPHFRPDALPSPRDDGQRRTRYAGPVNEKLHLSLVRFYPRPPEPERPRQPMPMADGARSLGDPPRDDPSPGP
ncbi:HNH endonuclease signature motif containing protein [Flexivirga caeni]|nr:HNH endonuclease signature motif containing protein [Flexivirga caeni]